jgi:heat shock protein HslJ
MRTKLPMIALAAAMLASCQTVPDDGPISSNGGLPYKALGTEPFWSLEIDGTNMVFQHEEVVTASNVEARPSFNGWRYTSANITADVTFTPCSDGMSEFTYKDTVTVMVGKKEYKGCGGGVVAPDTLERSAWRVTMIGNDKIPADRGAMIAFGDGRMSGTVGCNRLGGDYKYGDKKLSVGPIMSTRMACPDPVGKQEMVFTGVLGALAATEFPGDGSMVLTGKDGTSLVLEQSI